MHACSKMHSESIITVVFTPYKVSALLQHYSDSHAYIENLNSFSTFDIQSSKESMDSRLHSRMLSKNIMVEWIHPIIHFKYNLLGIAPCEDSILFPSKH